MSEQDSPGVLLPPPFIYVAGFLLGLALERWVEPPALPAALRLPIAALALVGAAALAGVAMALFLRRRTSPIPHRPATLLVADGPYRFSRNPMYLGMGLLYAGIALWFDQLLPLAFLPVVLLIIDRWVIRREEAYLLRRFGDEYRRYQTSVRRWI